MGGVSALDVTTVMAVELRPRSSARVPGRPALQTVRMAVPGSGALRTAWRHPARLLCIPGVSYLTGAALEPSSALPQCSRPLRLRGLLLARAKSRVSTVQEQTSPLAGLAGGARLAGRGRHTVCQRGC